MALTNQNRWLRPLFYYAVVLSALTILVSLAQPALAQGMVCESATEGALRYNKQINNMEFCNGNDDGTWIAIHTLKAGAGSQTCLPAQSGQMRFNKDVAVMELCDGANWRQMGKRPDAASLPASDPTTGCASIAAGTILYDKARKTPVYCDGSYYVALSSTYSPLLSTMVDGTPPRLISTEPAHTANIRDTTPLIVLLFNEPVIARTGTALIVIKDAADDSVVFSIEVANVGGLGTSSIYFTVTDYLPRAQSYYLEMAGDALQDNAGNVFAGISGSTALNFTVTNEGDCSDIGSIDPRDIGSLLCTDGAVYVGESGGRKIFAAPEDATGLLMWKDTITTTASANDANNGTVNQTAMSGDINSHPAAQACANRGSGWFLPASNELALVYAQKANPLFTGSFVTTAGLASGYWSSTQTANYAAAFVRFADGAAEQYGVKTYPLNVRCVRAN